MSETSHLELVDAAFKVGEDLTAPDQTIDQAVKNLNTNLADTGCDPSVNAEQVRGSWQTVALSVGSAPFKRAVRSATFSIMLRSEQIADTYPPIGFIEVGGSSRAVFAPLDSVDDVFDTNRITEGAVWIDPEAAEHRADIATQNADLLKAFMGGLATGGYSRRRSKRDMREEFREVLDSLWLRGSYHSVSESKLVANIMHKTGLRGVTEPIKATRRFMSFGKEYSYGLAVQRLLPESLLLD